MSRPAAVKHSITVLLILLAAAPVCAQQTPEELAARVAGCYELEIGPWPDALDRDYHPDPARLLEHVRLSGTRFKVGRLLPDTASVE